MVLQLRTHDKKLLSDLVLSCLKFITCPDQHRVTSRKPKALLDFQFSFTEPHIYRCTHTSDFGCITTKTEDWRARNAEDFQQQGQFL